MRVKRPKKKFTEKQLTALTSVQLKEVALSYLGKVKTHHQHAPESVLAAWPGIIGERLSHMTKAISVIEGVLTVQVNNSSLYSLLAVHEKDRLLKAVKEKFPQAGIKKIHFRIG
jgi:hypothetical protein